MKHGLLKRFAQLVAVATSAPWLDCFMVAIAVVTLSALPIISFGDEQSGQGDDKQFALTNGKGVPVCEAYLDLLNRTPLERTPFCGRPDNGPTPFVSLERHYLGVDEILRQFNYVFEFMRFDDQRHVERFFYPYSDPGAPTGVDASKSYWSADATTKEVIALNLGLNRMRVWTYGMPIDIANDGKPVRLLIWQGYGVSTSGASCGRNDASGAWDDVYTPQLIFVLGDDGITIDEARTRAIFGATAIGTSNPPGAFRPPVNNAGLPRGAKPFLALADSIGIFGYDGRYYIQIENKPAARRLPPPPVEVLLREHGNTSKVCAYRPLNVPIPE
jgi:hypothetical protein